MAYKSITEVPFLMLSRENIKMISQLEPTEKQYVWEIVEHYFLTGEVPNFDNSCNSRIVQLVWNTIHETIIRKVNSYNKSIEAGTNNFKKINEQRKIDKENETRH